MKTGMAITILFLLIVIAVQWKCNATAKQDAEITIAETTKQKDSLNALQRSALDSNLALNIRLGEYQQETNARIDSLKTENKLKGDSLKVDNTRAKYLISTIHDYAKQNKDSVIERLADSLELLRGSVASKVIYVFANDQIKDSINRARNIADSLGLQSKDTTIAQITRGSNDKDRIIANLQTALNKAIKSGNRKNILRIIGEAVLVVALIFKK